MKAIQSMILGEPNKNKPAIPSSPIKEEVKTMEQPSNNADFMSNEQVQNKRSQSTVQSNVKQQPPRQTNNLTGAIDAMYKNRIPAEKELAKERKHEKPRQIISAIADDVSAISNLYFTGKGVRNVEQTSMSAANVKCYQDILGRREKMQDKWASARLMAYDGDHGFNYRKDRDDANWKRSGEQHDNRVKKEDERCKDTKDRNKVPDEFNIANRDRNYELYKKAQEDQEKT